MKWSRWRASRLGIASDRARWTSQFSRRALSSRRFGLLLPLPRSHQAMQRRCLMTDAMGTLIELQPPAPRLAHELRARFGIEVSISEAEHAIAAEIRYYRAHMDEGRDELAVVELRRRCAEQLRTALPDPDRLSRVDAQSMVDALLASLEFTVFADAPAALRAARRHGQAVVVVSNWDSSLGQVLDRVGLGELIDGVVTSAAVGSGKPDPAIFEAALAVAGAAPRRGTARRRQPRRRCCRCPRRRDRGGVVQPRWRRCSARSRRGHEPQRIEFLAGPAP